MGVKKIQKTGGGNTSTDLTAAKNAKKDEFYTQLTDIEKEMMYYRDHFRGKVVFCNCDDPEESNFWIYFRDNFEHLGLKKLISTHYEEGKKSYKMELTGARYEDGVLNFDNFITTVASTTKRTAAAIPPNRIFLLLIFCSFLMFSPRLR